ncbi:MAG: type VI secretion system membrane subunit TssM, partial [Gammaproteobacteria bacterium]|nr:type VI secretion system membrane subunit TssM [Gammaproteobacteria bacterium]
AAEKGLGDETDFNGVLLQLDALRGMSKVYEPFDQDGVPWSMGMGLYQGDKLSGTARESYIRELNRILMPRIAARIAAHLRKGNEDTDLLYEALKLYLMLGEPERLVPETLSLWMSLDWRRVFPGDAEKQGRLETHLDNVLEAGIEPQELDQEVITNTRRILNLVPLANLVYGRLKRDALVATDSPFRVSDVVGRMGEKVFHRVSGKDLGEGIPGLFTYRGFFETYKKESRLLSKKMREESWVLGKDRDEISRAELEQLDEGILRLYLDDFIKQWQTLLGDLAIVQFKGLEHGTEVVGILSGAGSPMRNLLQAVERNTSLNRTPGNVAPKEGKIGEQKNRLARLMGLGGDDSNVTNPEHPGDAVERRFTPLNTVVRSEGGPPPLQHIMGLLSELFGFLGSVEEGAKDTEEIIKRISVLAARQPEPLKSWLRQLAANSRSVVQNRRRTTISSHIQAEWKNNALPECRQSLEGRYPIHEDGELETTLVDFGRIFKSEGILDNFFNTQLKPYVDTSGAEWKWKSEDGVTAGFSDETLTYFGIAQHIRDTFFSDGGGKPSVRFGLKPIYMDANVVQFILELEGQRFKYNHGPPRLRNATWPGPEDSSHIRLMFEDANTERVTKTEEGPWAWFRFLDQSRLDAVSDDLVEVTFDVEGRKIRYEIQASSVINPFNLKGLHEFRCPSRI